MYVEVYGNPLAEQIVFHHERLVAPWKGEPMQAPKIASVLPEVRRLILDGQHRKANELALATASQGPTKPLTSNLAEHPAFTLRIDTPEQHAVHDYLRTIDFESGEVKVRWADSAHDERRGDAIGPENAAWRHRIASGNPGHADRRRSQGDRLPDASKDRRPCLESEDAQIECDHQFPHGSDDKALCGWWDRKPRGP